MTRADDAARDDETGDESAAGTPRLDAAAPDESAADAAETTDPAVGSVVETDDPDVGFRLAEGTSSEDPAEQARRLTHRIARELAVLGPPDWRQLDAVFALTTTAELAQVFCTDAGQRTVRVQPTPDVLALVREQRQVSARLGAGPWWRMTLSLTDTGEIQVDYDYGDEPFPDDQLFPAEVYLADLRTYPRTTLPVWLAAYLRHEDRQSRTAEQAGGQARADRAAGVRAVLSELDFPAFPVLWSRWAVMSAAFVAAGSQWGPRVLPALGFFESSRRSGCTLYVLPGGRAVLSGGVWNAPELDAAYNRAAPLPKLYAGAPEWVANPVLNPRAANGMLSFCYWWEGRHWYRGDSPSAARLADAIPGIWTAGTVVDVVSSLLAEEPTARQRESVATLVAAAEVGVVTRDTLREVFGDDGTFEIDSAMHQLTMAGVALTLPEPMPQEDALAGVRRFIQDSGMDTTGYPLENLHADRLSVGWMVYVPTEPGEIAIGRAIFYIADDGVLEQSSSSVAPSVYAVEFEQRFQQRHGSVQA